MATKQPNASKKKPASTVVANCEVLPPEKALAKSPTLDFSKSAAVHFCSSEQLFVNGLKQDIALATRHATTAVYLALRIGLRLIYYRDNSQHGALKPFIEKHFAQGRSTLFNYIRVADAFLEENKLRDKRSHLLTDGKRIAPIIEQKLTVFDAKGKKDAVITKVVKWIDGRGLTQIYRDLSEEEDSSLPPSRKGKKPKPKRGKREIDESDFIEAYQSFRNEWESDGKPWRGLEDEALAELDTFLALARKDTTQLLRERK